VTASFQRGAAEAVTASFQRGAADAVTASFQQGAAEAVTTRPQQGAAQAGTEGAVAGRRRWAWLPAVGLLAQLVRSPRWLAGWAVNLVGFGTHAVALHLGSITIVQALLVVQLLFALPLSTMRTGDLPARRDWLATVAVCAGLVVLLTVRGAVPQTTARHAAVPWLVLVAGALILALVAGARLVRHRTQTRTALVAVAAGLCFCVTAVFVVLATDDLSRHPFLTTALDWQLVGLVVSTVLGGLLAQDAFASGSLPTALTAMAVTDPVASWVTGALVFDVHPPFGATALLGSGAAVLLVAAGVTLLANSPTLHARRAPVRIATARQEPPHGWWRLSGQRRRGLSPAARSVAGRSVAGRLTGGRLTDGRSMDGPLTDGGSIVDGRPVVDGVVERQHPVDGRRPLEPLGRGARGRAALVGGGVEQCPDAAG
jgi:uncharacterized membrane protein